MAERHSVFQTQWAAQFAVASELCKRGYQVALTLGNHPMVDLMVISPRGVPFVIDVKGLWRPNFWQVHPGGRKHPKKEQLFYVMALVPEEKPNRFFILTEHEATKGVEANRRGANDRRRAEGKPEDPPNHRFGIEWGYAAERFEGKWDLLPK